MKQQSHMRHLVFIIVALAFVLSLTSCGGKTTPVITKSDPTAGIYLGGKLPGISEEMMKDEKVNATELSQKIKQLPDSELPSEPMLSFAQKRLIDAWNDNFQILSGKGEDLIPNLNQLVQNGEIAGYSYVKGVFYFYDKTGIKGIEHIEWPSPDSWMK